MVRIQDTSDEEEEKRGQEAGPPRALAWRTQGGVGGRRERHVGAGSAGCDAESVAGGARASASVECLSCARSFGSRRALNCHLSHSPSCKAMGTVPESRPESRFRTPSVASAPWSEEAHSSERVASRIHQPVEQVCAQTKQLKHRFPSISAVARQLGVNRLAVRTWVMEQQIVLDSLWRFGQKGGGGERAECEQVEEGEEGHEDADADGGRRERSLTPCLPCLPSRVATRRTADELSCAKGRDRGAGGAVSRPSREGPAGREARGVLLIECDGDEQRLFASQMEACSVTGISSWHVSRACNINAESLDPAKGVLDWQGRRYYACYVSLGDCAAAGQPLAGGAGAAGARERRLAQAPDEASAKTAGKEHIEAQAGGARVASKPKLPPPPPPKRLSCLSSHGAPAVSASAGSLELQSSLQQQSSLQGALAGSSSWRLGEAWPDLQRWAMGLLQRCVCVCGVNGERKKERECVRGSFRGYYW